MYLFSDSISFPRLQMISTSHDVLPLQGGGDPREYPMKYTPLFLFFGDERANQIHYERERTQPDFVY